MPKAKYYYDAETLSYRPVEVSKVRKFSNFLLCTLNRFVPPPRQITAVKTALGDYRDSRDTLL